MDGYYEVASGSIKKVPILGGPSVPIVDQVLGLREPRGPPMTTSSMALQRRTASGGYRREAANRVR
jgi:hypothetical protein